MTPNIFTRNLTIFEGPDGAGKTTAAKAYAERTGAVYVHFGPLFNVTSGVARMYVEAMLPALLGYQDVVFDRSWLSETPYGNAFRSGQDRMGPASRRMLERLALRCAVAVVRCDPGWKTVIDGYENRGDREEMLTNGSQLYEVHQAYQNWRCDLPVTDYDFNSGIPPRALVRSSAHRVSVRSAGNWRAKIVLVGEEFADLKNDDAWYQWPFASFTNSGCSRWLTVELENAGIGEDQLLWVNSDQDLSFLKNVDEDVKIFALGAKAFDTLIEYDLRPSSIIPHPAYWKRFHHNEPYPLCSILKGA